MDSVRIVQVRSTIGSTTRQRETLKALGLGRIGRKSVRPNNAAIRGMIATVGHLVTTLPGDATARTKQAEPTK